MVGRDFYALLGVSKDFTDDELKKAYKKAAVKWHPDRHASKSDAEKATATEKFKEIAEAYEVLSDADKKSVYDRYGEEGLKAGGPSAANAASAGGGMPPGFGGIPGGGGNVRYAFSTNGGGGMDAARAEAMFASLFGGGGLGGGVRMARMGDGMGGGMSGFMMDDDDDLMSMMGGGMMGGMMGGGMGGGRMGGGARRRSPPSSPDRLPIGAVVRLAELHSQPEKNGKIGTVESWDGARGRYVVALQEGGTLAARPDNVRQVVTEAVVTGTSQDALNGKAAAAATFDRASKRYRCEGLRADGSVVSLKPEHLALPKDTRVRIEGVSSRPELNGAVGTVAAVDLAAGRYNVQLPSVAPVSLRFGAVAAC